MCVKMCVCVDDTSGKHKLLHLQDSNQQQIIFSAAELISDLDLLLKF